MDNFSVLQDQDCKLGRFYRIIWKYESSGLQMWIRGFGRDGTVSYRYFINKHNILIRTYGQVE